jgi:3-oxoacyl-[acyl-carrier-protein] synthase II
MGVVSCLGTGIRDFWTALCDGKCGLRRIERFDPECGSCDVGGEVAGLSVSPFEECGLSAGAQFALKAASEALAGYPPERLPSLGVVAATGFGPAELLEQELSGRLPPGIAAYDLGAGLFAEDVKQVAGRLGAGGPAISLSLSCASGNAAIVCAVHLIRSGRAEVVLVCGYDSIQRLSWAGLSASGLMAASADGSPAQIRPFDGERTGTLFSEGAGCLLLESAEHAQERGAEPLVEVPGGATNNDARHVGHPGGQALGMAAVIRMALADAGIPPEAVDHINAHGMGTKLSDASEARAFHAVFGKRASQIPVVSLKGGLGNAMGAAGTLEAVGGVMTLIEGQIPPTVNHRTPDPECALDVVCEAPRAVDLETILSTSAGIDAANAAVAFRRLAGATTIL